MARMRILTEAYRQLRADDPETSLTLYALRTLAKTGVIPTIRLGRKILINYDALQMYFNTSTATEEAEGPIRAVRK